jgi:hypothetical protein
MTKNQQAKEKKKKKRDDVRKKIGMPVGREGQSVHGHVPYV